MSQPPTEPGAPARLARYWLPVLLYLSVIFAFSAQPNLQPPLPFDNSDKLYHLLEYGGLGALLARALGRGRRLGPPVVASTLLLGMLTGAADEVFQRGVPGRRSSPIDWIADTVGVALGLFIYSRLSRARETAAP